MKAQLPMHPEEATTKLFGVLPKRTKDILEMRFGLGKNQKRMTLEAIGDKYGITRERVRQIEADGFSRVRKSSAMKEISGVFSALENYFNEEGKVLKEENALKSFSSHPKHENHIYFLLTLHDPFTRFHESDSLHDRWSLGGEAEDHARRTLEDAAGELRKLGKPLQEEQLFQVMTSSAKSVTGSALPQAVLANWVGLSKLISKNYFGEWGLTELPSIKPRGVRDLSYMVLSKKTEPLHFSKVASEIGKLTGKPAHTQTVHNELIKDPRFVLVGRGLYALSERGYKAGIVKDIISSLLREKGALAKEAVVEAVLSQRFVKPNTVAINLENKKYFKKLPDGRYNLR